MPPGFPKTQLNLPRPPSFSLRSILCSCEDISQFCNRPRSSSGIYAVRSVPLVTALVHLCRVRASRNGSAEAAESEPGTRRTDNRLPRVGTETWPFHSYMGIYLVSRPCLVLRIGFKNRGCKLTQNNECNIQSGGYTEYSPVKLFKKALLFRTACRSRKRLLET